MDQKDPIINLRDITNDDSPFGNDQGRDVYRQLLTELDKLSTSRVVGISLKGIKRTDASFPRESVISLAKAKRGERGFYLLDFDSEDLIDNWDYAAKAKEQPMIVLADKGFDIIGPELSRGPKELLNFIMKKNAVTASVVSKEFNITIQNASTKLKKLLIQGLVLGSKETAKTGGLEYVFRSIK